MVKPRNEHTAKIVKVIQINGMKWEIFGLEGLGWCARAHYRELGIAANTLRELPRLVEAAMMRDKYFPRVAAILSEFDIVVCHLKTQDDYRTFDYKSCEIHVVEGDNGCVYDTVRNRIVATGPLELIQHWIDSFSQ